MSTSNANLKTGEYLLLSHQSLNSWHLTKTFRPQSGYLVYILLSVGGTGEYLLLNLKLIGFCV